MAKKRKRKWGSPKQRAALKKGQRILAAKRKKAKKNPVRRKKVKRVVRKKARAAPRVRSQVARRTVARKKVSAKLGPFVIKRGVRYFDGAGFVRDKGSAASYGKMAAAKRIANKIAAATGGQVSIHG